MAGHRLALIGACEGPWVDVSRVRQPVLHVTGLKDAALRVTVAQAAGQSKELHVTANGFVDLSTAAWIQVCATMKVKSLVCAILSKKEADALHSP